jgi:hypothetical protein
MAPQILLPLLALHHDLYPVLLHLTLLHLAGMVSGLGTVIIYLALDYLFNKSLCSFLQFVCACIQLCLALFLTGVTSSLCPCWDSNQDSIVTMLSWFESQ